MVGGSSRNKWILNILVAWLMANFVTLLLINGYRMFSFVTSDFFHHIPKWFLELNQWPALPILVLSCLMTIGLAIRARQRTGLERLISVRIQFFAGILAATALLASISTTVLYGSNPRTVDRLPLNHATFELTCYTYPIWEFEKLYLYECTKDEPDCELVGRDQSSCRNNPRIELRAETIAVVSNFGGRSDTLITYSLLEGAPSDE